MKSLNKFLIPFSIITTLSLSLTQCDLITTSTSELLFQPKVVDFPLGEGKAINYPLTSWIDKPYTISINTEYVNSEKAWGQKTELPYRISVKCYQLEKNKEILFFEDTYIIREKSYEHNNEIITIQENIFDKGSFGWNPNNPHSSEAWGWRFIMKEFRLPYGRYRCDFKDESPKEIKEMMKKVGIVRTVIEIRPFKLFIY